MKMKNIWLVIAGARAQFKGTGTINGVGNYGFLLTAIDGDIRGGGSDRFRIKIWDRNNGDAIVYDNQMNTDDDAELTTVIEELSVGTDGRGSQVRRHRTQEGECSHNCET